MQNAPGVARCVFCGKSSTITVPLPPQSRGKIVVLVVLLLVAAGLWQFPPFARARSERDCQGGTSVEAVWQTEDPKAPRIQLPNVNQIDPLVTPHVELARLRSTGTRHYGDNNDHEPRHLHQGVVDALHLAGANAYFHAPSRPVGTDLSETVTTAALAHPGPIKRALRDRYLASGRGAMITQLLPGSPAQRNGLQVNDVVVGFNGQSVEGHLPSEVLYRLSVAVPPGGRATLQVIRANQVLTLNLERQGAEKFGYFSQTVPILEVVE
jgi:hypothetical protein